MKAIEKRRAATGQSGFTLIELLVVIAILGVLAGVVVFAVGGINDNSQEAACKIEKRTVKTALQAYKAQEGTYPTGYTAATETGGTFVPDLLDQQSDTAKWTVDFTPAPAATPTITAVTGGDCDGF